MARKRVPRKNVSTRLADIKGPGGTQPVDAESGIPSPSETEAVLRTVIHDAEEAEHVEPPRPPSRGPRARTFVVVFAGAAVVAGVLFAADFLYVRREFLQALRVDLPVLQSAAGDEGLPAGEAPGSATFDFRGAYRDLKAITPHAYGLLTAVGELRSRWPELLLEHRGEELKASVGEVWKRVAELETAEKKLLSGESPLRNFLPFSQSDYIAMSLHLARFKNFLDALVPWISSSEDRRVLVFLGNSSELRPGGGFLGSYLEIAFRDGDARQIAVRDINEPDRALKATIVPPQPLQPAVTRLRAADANWFFDFPTSARKTIELLEASELYKRDGITFDGAVAVTPTAVRDILEVTGPVALSEARLTLDKDNFLTELQRQVTQGERRGDPSPKKVLSEFFPALVEKMKELPLSDRERIAHRLDEWFARKDVLVYFKDPEFEHFFRAYELTGAVYDLPGDFYGDYFAVVHANVGGGKTDAVMQETVKLESHIGADGVVRNHVEIARAHGGAKSEFAWYRLRHEDYLRLFTVPQARLENMTGGVAKKIVPRVNYKTAGYARDPDVEALEATARTDLRFPAVTMLRESGKNAFATWVETLPGKTSRVAFDYQFRLPAPPADGSEYRFVFERQPGAAAAYTFTINAPLGFRFRENGLPVYEYQSDDPPGRLTLSLTLEKLNL